MKIRKARPEEINAIMDIYTYARLFMEKTGNPNQWIDGYPSKELILNNISEGNFYVCTDEQGNLLGVFYFMIGEEPTYKMISGGKWLNDKPYGVIHRMAGNGKGKGVADFCLRWCFEQCKNIRVDTHHDNMVMQNILKKNGYIRRGTIILPNGTPRIAFQKQEES